MRPLREKIKIFRWISFASAVWLSLRCKSTFSNSRKAKWPINENNATPSQWPNYRYANHRRLWYWHEKSFLHQLQHQLLGLSSLFQLNVALRNNNLPEAIIFPKSNIKKLVEKSILAEVGKVSWLFHDD